MPAVLGKCEAQNESMASLYFSKNVEHMQKIKSRCNPRAKVYLSTWWHYMCAQKVLDCRDLGYYAQDANVALPFTTPGHDGVIMCAFHSRTPRLRAHSCSLRGSAGMQGARWGRLDSRITTRGSWRTTSTASGAGRLPSTARRGRSDAGIRQTTPLLQADPRSATPAARLCSARSTPPLLTDSRR